MNSYGMFRVAAVLGLGIAVSACSSKPPGCADSETVSSAKALLVNSVNGALSQLNVADDPDGVMQKFFNGLKVELSSVVSNGYNADEKKQQCKASLTVTSITGDVGQRDIEYSTQKTEDKKNGDYLLEIQEFDPFITHEVQQALAYYEANRWAGEWKGTYSCQGINGAADGPQGPYSMPVTMEVSADKATLERTTKGGGTEKLVGSFHLEDKTTIGLAGSGANSPDDKWNASFYGTVTGNNLVADGKTTLPLALNNEQILRVCHLELTKN